MSRRIDSAASPPKRPVGGLFDANEAALAPLPLAAGADVLAERMLRRLANRHGCPGRCRRKVHERDVEALRDVLQIMGLR